MLKWGVLKVLLRPLEVGMGLLIIRMCDLMYTTVLVVLQLRWLNKGLRGYIRDLTPVGVKCDVWAAGA